MEPFWSRSKKKTKGHSCQITFVFTEGVHICSLIVDWLYLYRNNASDALFFVQFYVHASVAF